MMHKPKVFYHIPECGLTCTSLTNHVRFVFSGEGDNIRVYVRVRPPDKHLETVVDRTPCIEATSGNTIVLQSKPDPKNFSFDHVADINTTQVMCCASWTILLYNTYIHIVQFYCLNLIIYKNYYNDMNLTPYAPFLKGWN